MEKVLLHACCAPCSIYCIDLLREEGYEPIGFWYNPNIHLYTEYRQRRETFLEYAQSARMETVIKDEYGLRRFVQAVSGDIENRCRYCYATRLGETARLAKEMGLKYFTSTLLISPYQDTDLMRALARQFSLQYGVEFLDRDFAAGFRDGQNKARELGLYMQKYCGCIFSEEERYEKKITKDKVRFTEVF